MQTDTNFRLTDSGASGVWRAVSQVPEFVVESARREDFVDRMAKNLWAAGESGQPGKEQKPRTELQRSHASWDLAVAFAVHAATLPLGQKRQSMEVRCLDALECAIEAGHAPPDVNHPDFTVVARNSRFQLLARKMARS